MTAIRFFLDLSSRAEPRDLQLFLICHPERSFSWIVITSAARDLLLSQRRKTRLTAAPYGVTTKPTLCPS